MDIAKRIANANNDHEGQASTRQTGASKAAKARARKVNRAARREEKRRHTAESKAS